jgi:hypothetical protein
LLDKNNVGSQQFLPSLDILFQASWLNERNLRDEELIDFYAVSSTTE